MIVGQWGIILNLFTIAVITMGISVLATSLLFALFQNTISSFRLQSQKALLWCLALSPWLMAITTSLLFWLDFSTTFSLLPHWHHPDIFEFSSWHGVSVIVFLVWTAFVFYKKTALLFGQQQMQASLYVFSERQSSGICLIESAVPNAFTSGFFSPKSYLTTGLKSQLTQEELAIVLAHENAHVISYDPLKKWLFMVLAAFFPSRISNKLNAAMTQTIEQLADASVVELGYQNDIVASTLVKVARIAMRFQPNTSPTIVNYFHVEALAQRVSWLLNEQPITVKLHYLMMLLPCLLLVLTMFSLDSLHHLIETILNH